MLGAQWNKAVRLKSDEGAYPVIRFFCVRLSFMTSCAVLGRGATFLLMKDPAEIQGVVVSDNACNLIDGVSCIF